MMSMLPASTAGKEKISPARHGTKDQSKGSWIGSETARGWETRDRWKSYCCMVQKSGDHQYNMETISHDLQGFIHHPRWLFGDVWTINRIWTSSIHLIGGRLGGWSTGDGAGCPVAAHLARSPGSSWLMAGTVISRFRCVLCQGIWGFVMMTTDSLGGLSMKWLMLIFWNY